MKWLIALILLAFNVNAQTIDTTGNLVNNTQTATTVTSTWQNAKFVPELSCWVGGDPNCSAGQPYIRPDGNINFSYGYTELYQIVNVSKALPNSGTGLVTTGFVFSWRSKNGNGWDDGRLDQLNAYVQGYTKSGKWIENFGYNLNFLHDWTDFTWSQSWSKLRRPDELANVLFGFSGKDNNYWMGPYGPEITNVNFRLQYKPDPCVNNPLYSPDCPKFQETLAKISETYTVDNSIVKPTTIEYVSDINQPTKPTKTDTWQGDESRDSFLEEYNLDKLIDTLIRLENNQQREQNIATEAATTAISETDKITQQTLYQAEQVANKSIKQSQEIVQTIQQTVADSKQRDSKNEQSLQLFQTTQQVQNVFALPNAIQQINILQQPQTAETQLIREQNIEQIKPISSQLNNLQQQVLVQQAATTFGQQQIQQQQIITNLTTTNQVIPLAQQQAQTPELPLAQQNFLTNKADPINSILETKLVSSETSDKQSTQQVKSNTSDNSLAGSVTLAQIAVMPGGYAQYLTLALVDASFYPAKEVYRNQRTVDNARALRQLSSDRLHQQMIDQQWR